jgi:ABC-2 type transport system permease protein
VVELLGKSNFDPVLYKNAPVDDVIDSAKSSGSSVILVIPQGFEANISSVTPQKIKTYAILSNFSYISTRRYTAATTSVAIINDYISNKLITSKVALSNPLLVKNPIMAEENVIIGDRQAQANLAQVIGFITAQATFLPIILFLVIILTAQMIATAVAAEKENKTLETLLSMPVSRKMVVSAKMIGAGIVGLLLAAIYIVGFRSYLDGLSGTGTGSTPELSQQIISQLGIGMTPTNYVFLGLTLFAGILVALAIAIILGAFSEDVKGVQGTITPLMVLVMISYFSVLLIDINSLSPIFRYLIYAIPFSHPFFAMPNLFLHNYAFVVFGIIYQLVVFIIFVWLAAWIFSSDKILTLKFSFGKKKT